MFESFSFWRALIKLPCLGHWIVADIARMWHGATVVWRSPRTSHKAKELVWIQAQTSAVSRSLCLLHEWKVMIGWNDCIMKLDMMPCLIMRLSVVGSVEKSCCFVDSLHKNIQISHDHNNMFQLQMVKQGLKSAAVTHAKAYFPRFPEVIAYRVVY